jgi:hypothetical protein
MFERWQLSDNWRPMSWSCLYLPVQFISYRQLELCERFKCELTAIVDLHTIHIDGELIFFSSSLLLFHLDEFDDQSSEMTTSTFRWWPWSSSASSRSTTIDMNKTFRFRCLLNRQCAIIDENSHCTLSGRCMCNIGFKFDVTGNEQRCLREIVADKICD